MSRGIFKLDPQISLLLVLHNGSQGQMKMWGKWTMALKEQ